VKIFLLTISLGSILAVVMFGFLTSWDPSAISFHGWIALMLCTIFSLGIGGGLMALVFHSAHKGYDDQIKVDVPPSDDE